jgi:hypothetical protein
MGNGVFHTVAHTIITGILRSYLKMGIIECKLVKSPITNSNKISRRIYGIHGKSIYGIMQTRFYYGLIWLQTGFARQLSVESPMSNFDKICEKIYGI